MPKARSKTHMRLAVVVLFLTVALTGVFAQTTAPTQMNQQADSLKSKLGISNSDEAAWKKWIDNMYEIGVVIKGDSIFISEEARRVANDTTYRKFIYRDVYNWQETVYLMKNMQMKIGLWHMINLWDADTANRKYVLEYVLNLDQVLAMDRVLVAVFYTYGLLDAQVGYIKNGRPTITRPDIVEKKLATVNSIVTIVLAERKKRASQKK